MGTDTPDQELLGRLSNDPPAFEVFYRGHVDRVVRFTAAQARDPAEATYVVADPSLPFRLRYPVRTYLLRLRYTLQRAGRFCSASEPVLAEGIPDFPSRV
ncbi:MAG: hypothetical protein M1435_02415 [Actinobacteria bacterium]|nr:hypothetical protein [Actinomycetota bacterium]